MAYLLDTGGSAAPSFGTGPVLLDTSADYAELEYLPKTKQDALQRNGLSDLDTTMKRLRRSFRVGIQKV